MNALKRAVASGDVLEVKVALGDFEFRRSEARVVSQGDLVVLESLFVLLLQKVAESQVEEGHATVSVDSQREVEVLDRLLGVLLLYVDVAQAKKANVLGWIQGDGLLVLLSCLVDLETV